MNSLISVLSMPRSEIHEILNGKGRLGGLVVKVITLAVVLSTLTFSLSTVENVNYELGWLFDSVEFFAVVLFTVEYVLRVYTSPDPCGQILDFYSIVDLCSILPSWIDLLIPGDQFPAVQFLRMTRIFKFLAQSQKGTDATKAFSDSWNENKPLLFASMVGKSECG